MPASCSLLLAAFAPELTGLGDAPPKGWSVALTGVGAVCAAATTARLLAEIRPKTVLFIGTCGAYSKCLQIGDCIAVSEVAALSVQELAGRAFRPQIETTRWASGWKLPFPKHPAASTPAVTASAEDAAILGQAASVEQLELAGVYAACSLANVPVAAALAVANHAGLTAHAEWLENHEWVSRKLVKELNFDLLGDAASVSRN
jgi:purine-nucleoside phosphorylase